MRGGIQDVNPLLQRLLERSHACGNVILLGEPGLCRLESCLHTAKSLSKIPKHGFQRQDNVAHATIVGRLRAITLCLEPVFEKVLRSVAYLFVVLGATVGLFAFYIEVGTAAQTRGHQRTLRQEFRSQPRAPIVGRSETPAKETMPGSPVAELFIPRIDVSLVVVEGVRQGDLEKGPGRYPGSAPFGARGTTAIAGHRTGWGDPFIDLDKLRAGDDVIVRTSIRMFTYRVTRSHVTTPAQTWVLEGDPTSTAIRRLTLTTCTPKYSAAKRLIVWADLISDVRI